jgi:hypothetical protein
MLPLWVCEPTSGPIPGASIFDEEMRFLVLAGPPLNGLTLFGQVLDSAFGIDADSHTVIVAASILEAVALIGAIVGGGAVLPLSVASM